MSGRRHVAGLAEVVAAGNLRDSLEALRDHLAQELENAPAGIAIGPIAAQLRSVIADLEKLPDGKVSKVDDLARKRADRRAAASG